MMPVSMSVPMARRAITSAGSDSRTKPKNTSATRNRTMPICIGEEVSSSSMHARSRMKRD